MNKENMSIELTDEELEKVAGGATMVNDGNCGERVFVKDGMCTYSDSYVRTTDGSCCCNGCSYYQY